MVGVALLSRGSSRWHKPIQGTNQLSQFRRRSGRAVDGAHRLGLAIGRDSDRVFVSITTGVFRQVGILQLHEGSGADGSG